MTLLVDTLETPIGPAHVVTDGRALCALELGGREERLLPMLRARFGAGVALSEARDPLGLIGRLRGWFEGDLGAFDGVTLDGGGTPFQRRVWAALRRIPPGETCTYGALAALLGAPGAARAVGRANGQNPIAIVVPCHRVIGAGGALTGYAGGLDRKRWLLAHERRVCERAGARHPEVLGGGRVEGAADGLTAPAPISRSSSPG